MSYLCSSFKELPFEELPRQSFQSAHFSPTSLVFRFDVCFHSLGFRRRYTPKPGHPAPSLLARSSVFLSIVEEQD